MCVKLVDCVSLMKFRQGLAGLGTTFGYLRLRVSVPACRGGRERGGGEREREGERGERER